MCYRKSYKGYLSNACCDSSAFVNPGTLSSKTVISSPSTSLGQLLTKPTAVPSLNRWESMGYPRVSTLSNETLELSGDVDLEQLFQHDVGGVTVLGPCNGILCFSGALWTLGELHDYERLVLWNPATRESKILPQIHRQLDMPDLTSTFGFGFDLNTNDYKVVRILKFNSQCEVLVYSLRADSWRVIDSSLNPSYLIRSPCFPSYLNGVHHWCGYEKGNMEHQFLISFDMGNEVFKEVPLPPTEESSSGQIAVINDSVALISELEGGRYEKWVLDDSGVERSWTKKINNGPSRSLASDTASGG